MAKFALGRMVATPGVLELRDEGLDINALIARHASGDWGDLGPEDLKENEFALDKYLRLFSSYETDQGKVWIITEADRSATTVLLPEEY